MAKCKLCKTNIPDGTEYCKNCLDKEKAKINESYLDSLLNSVKNIAPASESIYKKTNNSNINTSKNTIIDNSKQKKSVDDMFKLDLDDIDDFEQYNLDDDLSDLQDDFEISDKELFGDDLSNIFTDISKDQNQSANNSNHSIEDGISDVNYNLVSEDGSNKEVESELQEETGAYDKYNIEKDTNINRDKTKNQELDMNEQSDLMQDGMEHNEAQMNAYYTEETDVPDRMQSSNDIQEDKITEDDNSVNANNTNETYEDDSFDADLNDLLNRLDSINVENDEPSDTKADASNTENTVTKESKAIPQENNESSEDDMLSDRLQNSNQEEEEDDILSLLNQISSDDPVADDVKAISELMSGVPVEKKKDSGMPSDVGEVFSDALKVVSNLNDPNINEAELLSKIPDKKSKKSKKNKKNKKKSGDDETTDITNIPKMSLFKRLFGNVEDKNASKKDSIEKNSFNDENDVIGLQPQKGNSKKGKNKKDKNKKGAASEEANDSSNGDAQQKGKSGKSKKESKKEKKEKKKKTKEIIQVIDEIDEDEGRINRLGASIVFIFFALLALLLFVGTNAVSYTLSITHATAYFDNDKYNEAYDEVYGLNIKDKDLEIYEKIKTVMFVNKQLNSYNNYSALKEYPQALDSLLKGLKRYDKYLELATMYGIKSDLDYVRKQILAELKNEFKLSEKEALKINKIENMQKYSLKVYDAAQKYE